MLGINKMVYTWMKCVFNIVINKNVQTYNKLVI